MSTEGSGDGSDRIETPRNREVETILAEATASGADRVIVIFGREDLLQYEMKSNVVSAHTCVRVLADLLSELAKQAEEEELDESATRH